MLQRSSPFSGAIAITGLGARWLSDYNAHKHLIDQLYASASALGSETAQAEKVHDLLAQLHDLRTAGVLAVLFGPLSLVGLAFLTRRPRLAALFFVAGAVVPTVFASTMLVPGCLLLVAAGLAIGASLRRRAPATGQPALALAA